MEDKKPPIDVTKIVSDALGKQGYKLERKEPASPVEQALQAEGYEIKATELELPAGKVLVPISALDQLMSASARLKGSPQIAEWAKSNPAAMKDFENLGAAVSAVAASAVEKKAGEPEAAEAEPDNQQGAVVLLLAGLAVGGLLLLQAQKKKQEQEAAARQAVLAAQAEAARAAREGGS